MIGLSLIKGPSWKIERAQLSGASINLRTWLGFSLIFDLSARACSWSSCRWFFNLMSDEPSQVLKNRAKAVLTLTPSAGALTPGRNPVQSSCLIRTGPVMVVSVASPSTTCLRRERSILTSVQSLVIPSTALRIK